MDVMHAFVKLIAFGGKFNALKQFSGKILKEGKKKEKKRKRKKKEKRIGIYPKNRYFAKMGSIPQTWHFQV